MEKYKVISDTLTILKLRSGDTTIHYLGDFDFIPAIGTQFKKGEIISKIKKPNQDEIISVSLKSNMKFCWFKYL